MEPLVSVHCITYNQERYIKECLDGILMQKTLFPVELLIHDDASTDDTQKILIEYQKKHPAIIKLWLDKENQFSKNNFDFISKLFRDSAGKYIALCEGDDYWTEPNKLQKQVDYLEANSDCAMCFHPVKVVFDNGDKRSYIFPKNKNPDKFTIDNLLKENYIQTNSVMYRKQNYNNLKCDTLPNDWYLHVYHSQFGKIGFINELMAIYRRSASGTWWDSANNFKEFWKDNWENHLKLFSKFNDIYSDNYKYLKIIQKTINNVVNTVIDLDIKNRTKIIAEVVTKYPEFVADCILENRNCLKIAEKQLGADKVKIKEKNDTIGALEADIALIKSSKFWKLRNKTAKIIGKPQV